MRIRKREGFTFRKYPEGDLLNREHCAPRIVRRFENRHCLFGRESPRLLFHFPSGKDQPTDADISAGGLVARSRFSR